MRADGKSEPRGPRTSGCVFSVEPVRVSAQADAGASCLKDPTSSLVMFPHREVRPL